MADDFLGLEGLLRDLEALKENRLPNIERLITELHQRINEFRSLLDHEPRSNDARRKLSDGEIEIDGLVYSINEDFRQQTIQVADEIDLNELKCAQLFLNAQSDAQEWDRSPIVSAIMRFHKRRHFLLESLRLAFEYAFEQDDFPDPNEEIDEETEAQRNFTVDAIRYFAKQVVQSGTSSDHPAQFWSKCFNTMIRIEKSLQRAYDRAQRASIVGQVLSQDEEQIMEYERDTLNTQHECLSIICTLLLRQSYSSISNFRDLLKRAKSLDKHDVLMLHYVPILQAAVAFVTLETSGLDPDEMTGMHNSIVNAPDNNPWELRTLYQAFLSWWVAEYKGRFPDAADVDAGTTPDALAMTKALKEGGLQFMLSIAQDVKKSEWNDPTKIGLTTMLLRETPTLPLESPKLSEAFQSTAMEQLQFFIEAFITNIPDVLRILKFEEDDQRKLMRSRFQKNTAEYQYELDTFLVIIAYAFQDSPESAKAFWVQDSNLFGFLQWMAKRQTTPRVAAFCEMLRSLSDGKDCAYHAHTFLLSEGAPIAGKLRRSTSLSWTQIFAELEFIVVNIKERTGGNEFQDQIIEPESYTMLESTLRLISHLSFGSSEARKWLWNTETPSLMEILLQLISTNIDSRMRACVFTTMASLLFEKSLEDSEKMWTFVDGWLSGGLPISNSLHRLPAMSGSANNEQMTFEMIFNGTDEPSTFMQLLNGLIIPIPLQDDAIIEDLPFPSNLGSSYRLPGIDSYIDFALGKVFAIKTTHVTDEKQLLLLRLQCLDFICSCLSSFNEDIVILANRSSLPVEKTLKSSSLISYVKLHPFARVMDWLFDEKCLKALFASASHLPEKINESDSHSPIVLSTIRAIEVMNFIMKYQSTYLDIVKPIIKQNGGSQKVTSHATLPTFEDAVLNHLNIIADLGLYCGLGHSELTLCSLSLLESLSSSRKLTSPSSSKLGRKIDRNKMISVLEKDSEAERISRSLTTMMIFDPREFEGEYSASGYNVKSGILSFIKNALTNSPDRPSIAHLLLGFSVNGNQLDIAQDGVWSAGKSLFHSIAKLALDYPDFLDGTFVSWASNIKEACIDVIHILCHTKLTSDIVMAELRFSDYIFLISSSLTLVGPNTLWDRTIASQNEFLIQDSSVALRNFLRQRIAFYDYMSRELRYASSSGTKSLLTRLQSVLLGVTTFPGEPDLQSPNIFDLLDFMEVAFNTELALPSMKHLKENDFSVCKLQSPGPGQVYDIARAHEVILVRRREFLSSKQGQQPKPSIVRFSDAVVSLPTERSMSISSIKSEDKELREFEAEAQTCLLVLISRNHWNDLTMAQFDALKSWIRLLILALGVCEFRGDVRDAFIQQAYQIVLPKFEKARNLELDVAIEFAELLNQLLSASDSHPDTPTSTGNGNKPVSKVLAFDGGSDMITRVFQAALGALTSHSSSLALRQPCYQVCSRFLRKILADSKSTLKRKSVLRNIKVVSENLITVLCDDITTADAKTRIFALLLLEALVALSVSDDPKLILDALDRLNFTGIIVDTIKQIPYDLNNSSPSEIPMVLSYHNACLALLLRISQTRHGSIQLLNAGFFSAVRDSEMFATDPDVGYDIDDPEALKRFFGLMLPVLRIINSIVLKYQSDQTRAIAHEFLTEYRPSIVGILKRFAGVGGVEFNANIDLGDLVDNLTVLISATGFLETDDKFTMKKRNVLEIFS